MPKFPCQTPFEPAPLRLQAPVLLLQTTIGTWQLAELPNFWDRDSKLSLSQRPVNTNHHRKRLSAPHNFAQIPRRLYYVEFHRPVHSHIGLLAEE